MPNHFFAFWRTCLLAKLGIAVWLATAATPARGDETRIETLSLAPIPESATIEIRLPVEEGSDDLQLSVVLAAEFAILLTEMGFEVVERGAELLFRFNAEEPTYAQVPARIEFVRADIDDMRVSQGDPDTFQLRVGVARERRPPMWAGFVQRSIQGAERREAYIRMANDVMVFWGRTHKE